MRAGDCSILLIDDDEVMRELLFALLTAQGYEVFPVASGTEALSVLQAPKPPSLILTDLQMPGLQGEELTTALRQSASPDTLLLGMSASTPAPALLRSLDAFLAKPFDFVRLEAAIDAARETRSSTPSSPSPRPEPAEERAEVTSTTDVVAQIGTQPALDELILSALARTFKPDQLMELYTLTLHDAEERHNRIKAYAAVDDLEAVRREAHAIKGAAGMVGARELQALAAILEGGTTLEASAIADFPDAFSRLRRSLNAKLQTT